MRRNSYWCGVLTLGSLAVALAPAPCAGAKPTRTPMSPSRVLPMPSLLALQDEDKKKADPERARKDLEALKSLTQAELRRLLNETVKGLDLSQVKALDDAVSGGAAGLGRTLLYDPATRTFRLELKPGVKMSDAVTEDLRKLIQNLLVQAPVKGQKIKVLSESFTSWWETVKVEASEKKGPKDDGKAAPPVPAHPPVVVMPEVWGGVVWVFPYAAISPASYEFGWPLAGCDGVGDCAAPFGPGPSGAFCPTMFGPGSAGGLCPTARSLFPRCFRR